MRVLGACSLGGAGHLRPLRPLLDAARRRGDDVLVIGPPALGAMVAEAGYPFRAGGEPAEAEVAPIRERLPVVPAADGSVLGDRELFGRLATRAMLPAMEEAFATWRPDLVLRDPCEYASAVVARRTATTCAQVAISLAEVEWGAITTAAPALEEHEPGLTGALRSMAYLTRFPASLDPSPFLGTVRFAEPGSPPPALLPDWWDGRTSPLVYVTFGTVLGYMSHATQVYRAALEAVGGLDARVLLTVGRTFERGALGPVPGNVHVEAWVDQALVLPHADLVVCHGGSGTVLGALGAGVPLVLVPLFADQFENGRRVAALGAGVVVDGGDDGRGSRSVLSAGDAPRVADAIGRVLSEAGFGRRARGVAHEMAVLPTADEALAGLPVTR